MGILLCEMFQGLSRLLFRFHHWYVTGTIDFDKVGPWKSGFHFACSVNGN
jgi:hypothetical protein